MIKMVNRFGHITEGARKAFKGARIAGGADEMVMIPGGYENTAVWNRLHALTADMASHFITSTRMLTSTLTMP